MSLIVYVNNQCASEDKQQSRHPVTVEVAGSAPVGGVLVARLCCSHMIATKRFVAQRESTYAWKIQVRFLSNVTQWESPVGRYRFDSCQIVFRLLSLKVYDTVLSRPKCQVQVLQESYFCIGCVQF